MDVYSSVIIEEQTGIDPAEVEPVRIAPFSRPDIFGGDVEVTHYQIWSLALVIRADDVECPIVLPDRCREEPAGGDEYLLRTNWELF